MEIKNKPRTQMLYISGHDLFDLMNKIVKKPRDELREDALFCYFCQLVEGEEHYTLAMRFDEVLPKDIADQVDWWEMSYMDFTNFTVNEMQKTIVFGNVNKLMFGVKELYEHVRSTDPKLYHVDAFLDLATKSLNKIDGCVAIDAMADEIESMVL